MFHFTRTPANLVGILRDEFVPHYCLEDYRPVLGARARDGDLRIAFPMVCFCDMPLSQAAAHMREYGQFGLGLSKKWGMHAGVSPVLYTYPDSATTEAVINLHVRVEELQGTHFDGAAFSGTTERFLCFVKPYEGELHRADDSPRMVRFYDEREWRFVPKDGWRSLTAQEFADARARNAAQAGMWPQERLSFEPSDIRYVVVAKDAQIPEMVDILRTIKSPKYAPEEVDLLCTRIQSAEQILADF